jgi:glycosyltransferase involved in cell wall biosynthesis
MNIIQVYQTNPFEEGQGGGVRYVKNLLIGLKDSCDSILFIGIGPKKELNDNISLIPITKELTGYIRFLFVLFLKLPFMNLVKYDIVHVHRLYFAIPFIILKPHLKIVCSLHGRTFSVFESNYGSGLLSIFKILFKKIELFCLNKIDYLAPVSQDVVNSFELKYNNFKSFKQHTIGSMFDFSKFKIIPSNYLQDKFGNNNKYVLFLGRLADVKNIDFLIELWSKKFQNSKEIKLVIAGDGELKDKLHKLNKKICNSNSPIFLGEIDPNDVPTLVSSSDLCVLSSKHEASPTIIKEALSSGIPIVTSDVGDVKEFILDRQNGIIVNKDFNEYESAIKFFLDLNLDKVEVLECSNKSLKLCSIEHICSQFHNIYKSLMS